MHLTATIHIKANDPRFGLLDEYAFKCKNLANTAIYISRQVLFEFNTSPSAFELINNFTATNNPDYKAIPAKVAQQTIMQVQQNFQSFWASIKEYRKDPSKFTGRPRPPNYLDKAKGRANIIFTKQAISSKLIKQGILSLSTYGEPILIDLGELAQKVNFDTLQQVKAVKRSNGYDIAITYKQAIPTTLPISNRLLSLDLGVNNLATVTTNLNNLIPLIINGKVVKSINQHFNKQKAKIQSQKDLLPKRTQHLSKFYQDKHTFYQRQLDKLSQSRNHKLNDYLHKASRYLINYAVTNHIDTIVIGQNNGWKQGIDIGRANNQKFVSIPFARLIELIEYKAKLVGISVIKNEESYTSKCSFLDNEPIERHASYLGKRVKRGLFKSSTGQLINADVNGSLNILRKVMGDFEFDPIRVCSTPKVINVLKQNMVFH